MKVFPSVVICLGHKLNVDRSLPPSVMERITEVGEVLRTLPVDSDRACLFTGGDPGRLGVSEGRAMKVAFEKFILPDLIAEGTELSMMCEEASRNTVENALYCRDMLRDIGCQKIYLVSSDYHIPRSQLIFKAVFDLCGIAVVSCPSSTQNRSGALREGSDLPRDVNAWNLREKIDFEMKVVQGINNIIGRYSLGPVDNVSIDSAQVYLSAMYNSLP